MIFPNPLRLIKALFRAAKVKFGGYDALVNDAEAFFRLEECLRCPKFVKGTRQCAECTCFVDLKILVASEECPLGRWGCVWAKNGVDTSGQ